MKTLYLLRHAEAATGAHDIERHLTPAGLQMARQLGENLRKRPELPASIICSPATRTRETLAALQLSVSTAFLPELYGATPELMLEIIQQTADDIPSVLLIGHNPGIHSLAYCVTGEADNGQLLDFLSQRYAPATLAIIEFADGWNAVAPGKGRLRELIEQ